MPATNLHLTERDTVLDHARHLIGAAWRSFDRARPDQPAIDEPTRALLALPLPEQGIDPIVALDDAAIILDESLSQSRPRYFAFVGSSGLEMGVLADALAACHDVNLATDAAAANLVEKQALRWLGELIGYPGQYGAFTSGGMLSNLTALSAARERALPGSRQTGIQARQVAVYASKDVHTSVARAVEILGLGGNCLRDLPVDTQRRLEVDALAQALARDQRDGVIPVAIVASAGTTLSGAIDPLDAIATLAQQYGVWLHVDGAYGAAAAATASARPLFAGLARADSISIDAHKWLYLPKACGVVLVRDRAALTAVFGHEAAYIPAEAEIEHPVEWTLEYSRPFRALKVWLALRTYGAGALRAAIEHNLAQAQLLASLIKATDRLELLLAPQLSVVLFRHHPAKGDLNEHNRRLARALQQDGRVYLAGATVDGAACLRACLVNYRTHEADVRALVQVVQEVGASLA